jgi:hypothetical protein
MHLRQRVRMLPGLLPGLLHALHRRFPLPKRQGFAGSEHKESALTLRDNVELDEGAIGRAKKGAWNERGLL